MGGGPLDGAMLDMVGEKVNIFGQKLADVTAYAHKNEISLLFLTEVNARIYFTLTLVLVLVTLVLLSDSSGDSSGRQRGGAVCHEL